jgi:hypothetical protein
MHQREERKGLGRSSRRMLFDFCLKNLVLLTD